MAALKYRWVCASIVLCAVPCAHAGPDYDFDFVTVGAVGNAPYMGSSPYGPPIAFGRGRVDYAYRIGRTEVTTSQWMEFVNTFTTRQDPSFGLSLLPTYWGARVDEGYQGPGYRFELRNNVPQPGMLPVAYISWRESARFCNWLHNGKSADLSSLDTGAYDTSTWGDNPPVFTDAPTHLPGARFWIPTLDEWAKATHYDPNRFGEGQEGWWVYPNGTDQSLVGGLPGAGQTSAGYQDPENQGGEWDIPLGAYPESQSPWGLWDASGGSGEWIEEVFIPGFPFERGYVGSWAGSLGQEVLDHVSVVGSTGPNVAAWGLRVAASVPTPPSLTLLISALFVQRSRRRREQ